MFEFEFEFERIELCDPARLNCVRILQKIKQYNNKNHYYLQHNSIID